MLVALVWIVQLAAILYFLFKDGFGAGFVAYWKRFWVALHFKPHGHHSGGRNTRLCDCRDAEQGDGFLWRARFIPYQCQPSA